MTTTIRLLPLAGLALLAACSAPTRNVTIRSYDPQTDLLVSEVEVLRVGDDLDQVLDGEVMTWHPNGRLKSREAWQAGQPHGDFAAYFASGAPAQQGSYLRGKQHGIWTRWHDTGAKASETQWAAGRLQGEFKVWTNDGHQTLMGEYRRDAPNGWWISWWPTGTKRLDGRFIRGAPHGRWTAWHPDGSKAAEGAYLNGKRNGLWIFWREDGSTMAKGSFRDDRPTGHLQVASDSELARDPDQLFRFHFDVQER
ncbi:MAG: hypothetical protein DRQ55_16055 [Planctomycetota bacterium]|nr:MAG: hypothetical protein DRQ55_16055 [Planctomycetota bacterium]